MQACVARTHSHTTPLFLALPLSTPPLNLLFPSAKEIWDYATWKAMPAVARYELVRHKVNTPPTHTRLCTHIHYRQLLVTNLFDVR